MTRRRGHAAPAPQPVPLDVTARGRLSALHARAARHPLTAFLVIVFGIEYPMVAIPILTHDLLGLIFRPVIGVFLRGTGGSVLLVALLHSVFNRTNNDNGVAIMSDGGGHRSRCSSPCSS